MVGQAGQAGGARSGSGAAGDGVHQATLAGAVEAVLARLDAHAGRATSGEPVPQRPAPEQPAPEEGPEPAPGSTLETVCSCFGLTAFERDVLVLAAAVELVPTTAGRCAAASGDPRREYPTFALALATLAGAHWSALAPVSPLRRWRLVELDDPTTPTTSRLRADERILHFLAGVSYLDTRLHGLASEVEPPDALAPAQRQAAVRVGTAWAGSGGAHARRHVELAGTDRQTRWEVAAAAARASGLALYAVRADDLSTEAAERDALARLWEREAVLVPAALLVEVGDGSRERCQQAEALLDRLGVPAAVSGDEALPAARHPRERVTVPAPTPEEQRELWATSLNGAGSSGTGPEGARLGELVAQFNLPAHVIRAAAAEVRGQVAADGAGEAPGGTDVAAVAWHAGLVQARVGLDELGRRVEPRAGWHDLVLPEQQRAILSEVVAHVRQRSTVYQDWDFASVLRRGLGITALFAGGSGTGKTLAAEVVAAELGLDLFIIDLSQVVSKYIGETEKNLGRVFDAAERGGAVLLFDEADALFGKRSEVKDSRDRYANIEVSYLLMRMEAYRGLAVLTTNMKKALDTAFLRRIRFVVDFPFPGVAERTEIWRRVIPGRVPVDGLDPQRLAQLTVAGGSIRNIALSAAFLAADEGCPLGMRHALAAARTEYLKLERSLTPGEVEGWV